MHNNKPKSAYGRTFLSIRLIAVYILLLISAAGIEAGGNITSVTPGERAELIESLKADLKNAETPGDSIKILYNLFDLSVTAEASDYAIQLVRTARNAGKNDIALDALRNYGNLNLRNDSLLLDACHIAEIFPPSHERDMTMAFLKILYNSSIASDSGSEERSERLRQLMHEYVESSSEDPYDRIILLQAMCINLSRITQGESLIRYMLELDSLVSLLPDDDIPLRNSHFVRSSMLYTENDMYAEAIQTSRQILDEMDKLDRRNARIGRQYKSYDANRYIAYTHILENYPALDSAEVEKYYSLAKQMAATDSRAGVTDAKAPLPDIYYNIYHKNYRKAFDLIKDCKDNPYLKRRRLRMYRLFIEVATALGENNDLLEAYPVYTALMNESLDRKQRERLQELQEIYEMNNLRAESLRQQAEEQKNRRRQWQTRALVLIAVLSVLLVYTLVLRRLNRRRAKLAMKLQDANSRLRTESQSLRETRDELEVARDIARSTDSLKTDFINNMSHEVKAPLQLILEYAQMIIENTDSKSRPYMAEFADGLQRNCELVSAIVNDVLQLAELHNTRLPVTVSVYESQALCEMSINAIRARVKKNVSISVADDSQNFLMRTDRQRVIQILTNLLSNAAKFTEKGSITIGSYKSEDGRNAVFAVTDTGRGVPPASAEVIFERFTKLDNNVPGAGLGLTISRIVARLLKGELVLDTSYTGGARFVLTLPLKF